MKHLYWVILTTLLVVFCIHDNPGPDYWYHLLLGKKILATAMFQPSDDFILQMPDFVNIYWLFQILMYIFYSLLGQFGPALIVVTLCLITASAWVLTTGVIRSGPMGALLALASLLIWNIRFEWRPELISYAGIAIFIFALRTPNVRLSKYAWAGLLITQWIWSCSHGYFVFGPGIVGIAVIAALIQRNFDCAKRLAWVLLSCVMVSLMTPFHIDNWSHVFMMHGFLNSMRIHIQEFMAPTHPVYLRVWTVIVFWMVWTLTLFFLPFGMKNKNGIFAIFSAIVGLYLSACYYRNIPLLPLFAAPLFEIMLKKAIVKFHSNPNLQKTFERVPSVLALAVIVLTIGGWYYRSKFSSTRFGLSVTDEHAPVSLAEYLNHIEFKGRIFNTSSEGGYLALKTPIPMFYGDSRFTNKEATLTFFAATNDSNAFQALDAKENFDGVALMVLENQRLVHHLLKSPDWVLFYTDLSRAFFVKKSSPQNHSLAIRKFEFLGQQDLKIGDNIFRSQQWVNFFAAESRIDLLELALKSYLAADIIHPGVMATAFRYYQSRGEIANLWRLRDLQPRIANIEGKELRFVTEQLSKL